MTRTFQYILGIRFFTGDFEGLLESCASHFVVVPSAPTLVELVADPAYREAMEQSDFAITDSAFMVMLWKIFTGQSLTRISGLKLLRGLLADAKVKTPGASFWVMPSAAEMEINLTWLNAHGFSVTCNDCYVAPLYPSGQLTDLELLQCVKQRQPRYILINIGGGVQERLGHYLRKHLPDSPAIICVGAAIAFITGLQANIPVWADAYGLGWFLRCLQAPGKFIPRYWKALRLVVILARYRERSVAG